jgi:hypothetical protein
MLHIQKDFVRSSPYKKKISHFVVQEQSQACVILGLLILLTFKLICHQGELVPN